MKASSIDCDQNKREISANYIPFFAACPPDDYRGDRYRVEDNRLILVHKEELSSDNCTLTTSDLIRSTMVTRVVRYKPGPGLAAADPSPEPPPSDPQPPNSRELVASVRGDILYEHPLDDHREGLLSNARERRQVGAGQFVFSDKVFITGIRWYGYYTCNPARASRLLRSVFTRTRTGYQPPCPPVYDEKMICRECMPDEESSHETTCAPGFCSRGTHFA